MGVKEKAMPLIFSAIQAVSDAKRVVESRIQAMLQEALKKYESELDEIKSRLSRIESALTSAPAVPPARKAGRPRKAAKAAAHNGAAGCSMAGCGNKHMARGLCKNHYYQFKRGTIVKTPDGYALAKEIKNAEGGAEQA
jgi:hypothetical protein